MAEGLCVARRSGMSTPRPPPAAMPRRAFRSPLSPRCRDDTLRRGRRTAGGCEEHPPRPGRNGLCAGEYWNARADASIEPGERVEVTGVGGLLIRVRQALPLG